MLVQELPMRVCRTDLRILASRSPEFIDITADVEQIIQESRISDGIAVVFSKHTTAAVTIQENEPLLLQDLCDLVERVAPKDMFYRHDDFDVRVVNMHPNEPANGHAHCRQSLFGPSESIPISGGRLSLGQWGRVFFVELDAPREREVQVQVLGV